MLETEFRVIMIDGKEVKQFRLVESGEWRNVVKDNADERDRLSYRCGLTVDFLEKSSES